MTTTREATLEAALKLARNRLQACAIDHPTGSREMAERSEWADEATAALSTPATEPQGYVEITEEMIVAGRKAADDQYYKWCGLGPREDGQGLDGMHFIVREALKAALSTQATKYAVPADWPKKMLPLDEHVTPGAGPLAARPAAQPAAEQVGWVIANGADNRWRCVWEWESNSEWTDDKAQALKFATREDAERFSKEDEDAWLVYQVGLPQPAADTRVVAG